MSKEEVQKELSHANLALKKKISLFSAIIPVIVLKLLILINALFFDWELFGSLSGQWILLISSVCAAVVGLLNECAFKCMFDEIYRGFKSIGVSLLILLTVGALSGAWLVSGIIPTMMYYGLKLLTPEIFLPLCVVISALISLITGSSWTTSATVGIAFMGIGNAMDIHLGMIAGAVISGAYFGDKMSPMSDTTNLSAIMGGSELFSHIRYMSLTTVPSILITLIIFSIMGLTIIVPESINMDELIKGIERTFVVAPWLLFIPLVVVILIFLKVKPVLALFSGVVLSLIVAVMIQPVVVKSVSETAFIALKTIIFNDVHIETGNEKLNELFSSSGILGMSNTIFLIIVAVIYGSIMDAIGAVTILTEKILSFTKSVFSLFATTVISCIGVNMVTADQYLSIVIPGKMFQQAYKDKNLAPENLSRTLEDSGTVTSVLIPWNSCGAYQSSVLGVDTLSYIPFAIFNWLSPFTTLFFAVLNIKIKELKKEK